MIVPVALEESSAIEAGQRSVAFVVFRLGAIWYAVGAEHVKGMVSASALAPVPGTPDFVLGVANVSGQIAAVIDVSTLLGRSREPGHAPRMVLFESAGRLLASIADEISGVHSIKVGQLRAIASGEEQPAATETFTDAERVITVLDFEALVALATSQVFRNDEGAWA